jgi:hypothetical protein
VPESLIEEVKSGLDEFPGLFAELATNGKCFTLEGPFPIRHPDLAFHNIIVDENFEVQGIIDWEGASTLPWELMDSPPFLTTVPRLLNSPERYDAKGQPLDKDEAGNWADEEAYATMIREQELVLGADSRLSGILGETKSRDLASLFHLYGQGKIGLYRKALAGFA